MPQEINISDDDIRYSEKLLLPEGKEFDDERKEFIRNFNTIDLQAVPGSGKTTALLAKLVILEKKLPFSDGSGILVISHTNAAINEIKNKIQKHSPKLFSYPNFVGTIQSFVDEFLAIPFYISCFKKKPNRIDNEIYEEAINKKFNRNLGGFTFQEQKNAKYFILGNNCLHSYRLAFKNNEIKLFNFINGSELQIIKPKRGNNWQDFSDSEKNKIQKWMIKLKYNVMEKDGSLHFDDAYFLSDLYLSKYSVVKVILQKRFSYVFVDEMQDMDTHQYNLLEKIFYNEGNSSSIYQRIGDKNQAIFNSVKADEVWENRAEILRINGSNRLSSQIADVVKKFALYNDEEFDIIGMNECQLKPHILVFNNTTISNVIPFFSKIVLKYKDDGLLANFEKSVNVVCWNTVWKNEVDKSDPSKLRLEDYFLGFTKEKNKPKQDYDCLKAYLLYYDKSKKTFGSVRNNIINAILKILRLENITAQDERPFTRKKLIDSIKEKDFEKYEEFLLYLYNWSLGIIKGRINNVWNEIKAYIPNFINIFIENPLSKSDTFINSDVPEVPDINSEEYRATNIYNEDGFEIEITSVHGVKGQTHCATLYLESYYQKDGKGENAKSYESQRLAAQFLEDSIEINKIGERVKESAKMVYVGFSRPSDLLCFAVHKDRFDKLLNGINKEKWEILEVPNQ